MAEEASVSFRTCPCRCRKVTAKEGCLHRAPLPGEGRAREDIAARCGCFRSNQVAQLITAGAVMGSELALIIGFFNISVSVLKVAW